GSALIARGAVLGACCRAGERNRNGRSQPGCSCSDESAPRKHVSALVAPSCARDGSTAVCRLPAASAAALRQQLAEPGGVGDRLGQSLQLLVPPVALVAQLVVLELRLAPASLTDLEGGEVEGIADVGGGQPGRIERQVGELQRGAHRRLEAQRAVE